MRYARSSEVVNETSSLFDVWPSSLLAYANFALE